MKRLIIWSLFCLLSYNGVALHMSDKLNTNIAENDLFITKTIRSDNEQYFVEVLTKELTIHETFIDGEKFCYVCSKDCPADNIEGNPTLPLYIQSVALPVSSTRLRSVSVEELEWDTITVDRLMPQQPSLLEGESAKRLVINKSVYEDGWYYPKLVQTNEIQSFRGISNTAIRVCPFKYNARYGKLAVLRRFRLTVSFAQDNANTRISIDSSKYHSLFNNIATPSNVLSPTMCNDAGGYDYLIIVGDIPNVLESEVLKEFRKWKALMGIKTKVVTTDTTGFTDTSIKTYIESQYTSDSIKYVLFIGKAHHIPQHIMSCFTSSSRILRSDYWYGCMDGANDMEADIAIGRYSVNSLQELENAMKKSIKYEMGTNANGKSVLLVAHQQNVGYANSFQSCLEGICTNSNNSNFSYVKEYGATVASGGTGATSASVAARINQEVGIFNYRGHAGPFFWRGDWSWLSRPLFDSLMVSTFTNEKYPIALSIACETGRIDSTGTCLMDLYMNGEHGISSGLGATADSWHNQNNKYNEYLYAMINSENDGLGFININAHHMCMLNPSNYYKDNMFCYCCFGDPSLRVWTDSIKRFTSPSIDIISDSIRISTGNITDYEIIVASESNEVIGKYLSSVSNYSIPLPSESCTIALHKCNYESYLFDYIASNYVQNRSINRRTFTSASPIALGNNVTSEVPIGNVVIENDGVLQIKQHSVVNIPNGFECKLGGKFIIK